MERISYKRLPLWRKLLFIVMIAFVSIILLNLECNFPVFWFSAYLIIINVIFTIAEYYSKFLQKIILENFMSSTFFWIGLFLLLNPDLSFLQGFHWLLIGYSFVDAAIINISLIPQKLAEEEKGLPKG